MKTKEDLLKFYGVELGKKYLVTKATDGYDYDCYLNKMFEVKYKARFKQLAVDFECNPDRYLGLLNYLDYIEVNQPFLMIKKKSTSVR